MGIDTDTTTVTFNLENLTEDERKQLIELTKKANGEKINNKLWKPKRNENFSYINSYGDCCTTYYTNTIFDNSCLSIGNCFRTEDDARFAIERLKVIHELKVFAEENNDEIKNYYWYLIYNKQKDKIEIINEYFNFSTIYFSSKEIAQQAINTIGEDRIKKYYLQVED